MQIHYQKTIPFSAEEYQKKQAELEEQIQLRKEVIERLKTAREMGDLSENGAYHAAKFELGNIGRRIRYLKEMINTGYIAAVSQAQVAGFGKTVTLKNETDTLVITLVSLHESDLATQKISLESPLGKAVAGKKVGESVSVHAPRGTVEYTVVTIV